LRPHEGDENVKKIDAVIREERLPAVIAALEELDRKLPPAGYPGITMSSVRGHGRQKGSTVTYRTSTVRVEFLTKVLLTIIARDSEVEEIVSVIVENARTGAVGDGKIWVTPVDELIRVRTGERGEAAL
jgi:nitrogen regulatory protein P-II 1